MKISILTFFILSSAHASDLTCLQRDALQEFGADILEKVAVLGECPTDDEIIMKLVTTEYKNFYGPLPQVSGVVKGKSLKGSALELKIARELLGAKPPKAWTTASKSSAFCSYQQRPPLQYWRSTSHFEVDFIFNKKIAIEVKAKEVITAKDMKGLKILREENILSRYVIISTIENDYVDDGIEIFNWKSFLNKLWNNEFS